jgi:Uma2 family endonuclease
MTDARVVELSYSLSAIPDDWELPDDIAVPPESRHHDLTIDRLRALLSAWITRSGRDAIITRNLAVRWIQERPNVGIDPDIALIEPSPPDADELLSLTLWKPGNPVPRFAVEVVSQSHPYKDYGVVQERYAAFGVGELVVLDARLLGPRKLGGPFAIQIWRSGAGRFSRVYAGSGPAHSEVLGAWIQFEDFVVQISDECDGTKRWLTEIETLERRVRELEDLLKQR